jgi:chromosomal replication initiator protein
MFAVQDKSTVNFFRMQFEGGKASIPNNKRKEVGDDQCADLVNLMQEIIKDDTKVFPTEKEFLEVILKAFNVEPERMKNPKDRHRELVFARQWHMYVRFFAFKMSLSKAGKVYGKDHATVLHAIKTINNLNDTDKEYRNDTEDIWKLMLKFGITPDDCKKKKLK